MLNMDIEIIGKLDKKRLSVNDKKAKDSAVEADIETILDTKWY